MKNKTGTRKVTKYLKQRGIEVVLKESKISISSPKRFSLYHNNIIFDKVI